ncbi:MAG: DinB family protein [Candidatus Angelobacter sp. Gp1-AA117]|nr:MAG: DinB family protein [Candidatus Angelobacter sp. Gp1-AA117]
MKNLKLTAFVLLLSLSTLAMTQATHPNPVGLPNPVNNAQAQADKVPVGTVVENQLNILEREFVGAAEAMPEDKYNFTPASLNIPGSDYKGVRTFAEEVKHVATTNYEFFSAALGEKSTVDTSNENGPASITSKADIIKFLKDSFALGHRAAKALTAQNYDERVSVGQGKSTRLFLNTFAVAHGFDHYGQMVEYLRMNGIIPPASRPRQ